MRSQAEVGGVWRTQGGSSGPGLAEGICRGKGGSITGTYESFPLQGEDLGPLSGVSVPIGDGRAF